MRRSNGFVGRMGKLLAAATLVFLGSVQFGIAQSDGKASGEAKASGSERAIIRIKAGVDKPFKDSKGNVWLADVTTKEGGFEGGDTIERPDLPIENTKEPGIYRAERYSMDSFSWKLPNGKYVIKLHFAETYDGIAGVGDRIFSFKVQNKEFKDFDVWKKAGGAQKAYIETVPVEVIDGKLKITFTANVQNPEINGIEIIPAELAEPADKAAAQKPAADKSSSAEKPAAASPDPNAELPVKLTAQEDHQRLMGLLNMTTIRRGADGNANSPNAANYDEAKANPYPDLPDPLVLHDGGKVTTAAQWWRQRRPEIVEDFDREIYGRVPATVPQVRWEVTSTTDDGTTKVKQIVGHVDNSACPAIHVDIQVTLTTPTAATGPVPVMLQFSGGFGLGGRGRGGPGVAGAPTAAAGAPATPGGVVAPGGAVTPGVAAAGGGDAAAATARGFGGRAFVNVGKEKVLAAGWGWATINTGSVQADNGGGLTEGIIGLCNKGQPRGLDDWGVLRAWAWGASRALDYFETDKDVDAKQVGLEGHSRWGKATIVAMAYDPRFAIAYVSSSGEGGAKLHRRDWGEKVENIAGAGEYHWMAGNFIKYAGPLNWGDLPVDSHELVALCAPRPVFISAGATNGDGWVDAKGSFLAAAGAGPVYKLLGKKDLGTTEFPPIETGLLDGEIAFRQHSGGHTDGPNWPTFLTFAGRYIKGPALAEKPLAEAAAK